MKPTEIYCLFEQSGVFKTEFKKLGFKAYDVDILNDFGETDFVIDIFAEIQKAYKHEPSLFDKFTQDTLIFAFFPCTRFTEKVSMNSRGDNFFCKNYTPTQKIQHFKKMFDELHFNYSRLCELCEICFERGFKMIIENPDMVFKAFEWGTKSFKQFSYSCYDENPRFLGDYFPFHPSVKMARKYTYTSKKIPTNFWFFNFDVKYQKSKNFEEFADAFEIDILSIKERPYKIKRGEKCYTKDPYHRNCMRNDLLMSPIFANRFIREFIL